MREPIILDEIDMDDPPVGVLEDGLTHKVLLALNIPSRWPDGVTIFVGFLFSLLVSIIWQLLLKDDDLTRNIALLQALFLVTDAALLYTLPKQRISFGAWQPQWMALAIPRIFVSIVIAFLALLIGDRWGLSLFIVAQLIGTTLLLWGAIFEPFRLGVSEILVLTDRLEAGTPPIRMLHISDLHVEKLTQREARVIELTKQLNPDLIVITGDYVNLSYNRDPETLAQTKKLLRQLTATHGVFATLGSPSADYRKNIVPLFDGTHISLLRQDWEAVNLGSGRKLAILGIDCTHYLSLDATHLADVMQKVPAELPQILLYHSPELMPEAAGFGVDLYLCGHTHGGQVRLPIIGPLLTSSQLGRRFVMGLYKIGRTHLYVSRGVGLEGLSAPRIRLLCPPEMTLVTIVPNG